jgi:hypothetical protein
VTESVEDFMRRVAQIEWMDCPHCGAGRFQAIAPIPMARRRPPLRGPP